MKLLRKAMASPTLAGSPALAYATTPSDVAEPEDTPVMSMETCTQSESSLVSRAPSRRKSGGSDMSNRTGDAQGATSGAATTDDAQPDAAAQGTCGCRAAPARHRPRNTATPKKAET